VFLGYLADKYKLSAHFVVISPVILTIAYLLSLVISPLFPFLVLGLGGALSQISLWTCLALAVDEKKIVNNESFQYELIFFYS